MNIDRLRTQETALRRIGDQTRYPRFCPRWLRPLLHLFRLRDINRETSQILLELSADVARLEARVHELEASAAGAASPPAPKARIMLDVTCTNLSDNKTGVQRVVRNLAREFARLGRSDADLLLVTLESGHLRVADDFYAKLGVELPPNATSAFLVPRTTDTLVVVDGGWYLRDQYEQSIRRLVAAGGAVVGIIHDIIPLLLPRFSAPSHVEEFQRWFELLRSHSRGLVCISETVADEVRRHLANDALLASPPVDWFHLGGSVEELDIASAGAVKVPALVRRLRAAGRPIFLMVGTLEPRKDHDCALDALERLWAGGADPALVIVGSGDWQPPPVVRRIRHHAELDRSLFWLERCNDAELRALYASVDSLLFTSRAEGFGLPMVEAASFGLPIICSDIPVFREIAGAHAVYFPPGDPVALAEAIGRRLRLKAQGRDHSSRGMPRLTWQESASMLLRAIDRIVPSISLQAPPAK